VWTSDLKQRVDGESLPHGSAACSSRLSSNRNSWV
jgi:hypothetical protein